MPDGSRGRRCDNKNMGRRRRGDNARAAGMTIRQGWTIAAGGAAKMVCRGLARAQPEAFVCALPPK